MTKTRQNNVIIPTVKVLYKHMQVLINKKMDWKFRDVKPFFYGFIDNELYVTFSAFAVRVQVCQHLPSCR